MDNLNNNLNEQQLTKRERRLLKKQQREQEHLRLLRRKKIKKVLFISLPIILIVGGIVFGLMNYSPGKENSDASKEKIKATVFYSPTCSCCQEYTPYFKRQGFSVEAKPTRDMLSIKEQYQIPSKIESCHTTIIGDYFIEGHMPIEAIKKLLEEKPDILGIALPGMPVGSPGMSGPKTEVFKIYGLSKEGEISEFLSL